MNRRTIVASLNKIANQLDNAGLSKESDAVTLIMEKLAQFQQPQMQQISPLSKPNDQTYGYQAAVDKWITTNQTAVNDALQSPMPMKALAPLLMKVQPVELANAIRVKIGQMKQGLS
jgi:hypothetical protein